LPTATESLSFDIVLDLSASQARLAGIFDLRSFAFAIARRRGR
jgi:hypothetical protein